jgi:hypothetical protein
MCIEAMPINRSLTANVGMLLMKPTPILAQKGDVFVADAITKPQRKDIRKATIALSNLH